MTRGFCLAVVGEVLLVGVWSPGEHDHCLGTFPGSASQSIKSVARDAREKKVDGVSVSRPGDAAQGGCITLFLGVAARLSLRRAVPGRRRGSEVARVD
jgi:hypothetical protein